MFLWYNVEKLTPIIYCVCNMDGCLTKKTNGVDFFLLLFYSMRPNYGNMYVLNSKVNDEKSA